MIRKILKSYPLDASAPCRIDSGGTWDIKSFALPLEKLNPVTVNMALNLRTRVSLSPFKEGRIKISSQGFSRHEDFPSNGLPFDSRFGLFFAAVSYFGFHGLQIHIRSDSPVKSALGGSSTALIALLKALSKLNILLGRSGLSRKQILHLGYHLEDAVSAGKCGIQDQAVAVYGGVNRWVWNFGNRSSPFERSALLDHKGMEALSKHIIVAFSGKSHVSSRINRDWIQEFLSGKTRSGWIEANNIVKRFAKAVFRHDWSKAAHYLRDEMMIRREITPEALIPITEKLIEQAEDYGCGARFTGAGAGGSVWALGAINRISKLKMKWEKTLMPVKGARVLDCVIDLNGVN